MSAKDRRLGKGLDALLGETASSPRRRRESGETIAIGDLAPGPFQPRRVFDDDQLQSLANSIEEQGIVQPILVRPAPNGPARYEIIAGERRWRAAQRARLHQVPVIIRQLNDRSALEIALVENVQREDLNALEEAGGYRRLIDEFEITQEALAKRVGKSRSHVANTLRLLGLPEAVRALVEKGSLSAGHGRALLVAEDPVALSRTVISGGFNVRQTEKLVTRSKEPRKPKAKRGKSADVRALESDLSSVVGLEITIDEKGRKGGEKGQVRIAYNSLEQLDDVIRRLKGSVI